MNKELAEKIRFSNVQEMEDAGLRMRLENSTNATNSGETTTQTSSNNTLSQYTYQSASSLSEPADTVKRLAEQILKEYPHLTKPEYNQNNMYQMEPEVYKLLKELERKAKEAQEIEKQKQELLDQIETYSVSSKPTAPMNTSNSSTTPITSGIVNYPTTTSEYINRFPTHQTRTPKSFKVNELGKRVMVDTASERSYNSNSSYDTYRLVYPNKGMAFLPFQQNNQYSSSPTPSSSDYSLAPSQDSLFALSERVSQDSQDLGSMEERSDIEDQRQAYRRNERDQREEQNRQQLEEILTPEECQSNHVEREMEKLELEMAQLQQRHTGLKQECYKQTLRKEAMEKEQGEKQQFERQQHEKQVMRQKTIEREAAIQQQHDLERKMYDLQEKERELHEREAQWAEYIIARNSKLEREECEKRGFEQLRNQQINIASAGTGNCITLDLNQIANETMDHII
jgi:hypothetical protein